MTVADLVGGPGGPGLKRRNPWVWRLFALFALLRLALAVTVPLTYKEAYYWEWSRFLSPGYLDHPPLVAVLVRCSTAVLGDTLLGVRLPALVLGTASLLLIRQLAWLLFEDRSVADRALLLAHALPVLEFTGVLMFPDAALVCAFLVAACGYVQALRGGGLRWWLITGLGLGVALESKLMAIPGLVGLALHAVLDPDARRHLRTPGPWLALCLAGVLFLPYLWWNAQHDWLGLWIQGWDRHRVESHLLRMLGRAAETLFVEQFAAAGFLALPLWWTVLTRPRNLSPGWHSGFRLLRCLALPTFLVFLAAGTVTETHPHWTVLGYPAAAIALATLPAGTGPGSIARWPLWPRLNLGFLLVAFVGGVLALNALVRIDPASLGEDVGEDLAEAQQQLFWLQQIERALAELEAESGIDSPVLFGFGSKRTALLGWHRGEPGVVDLRSHLRARKKIGEGQFLYRPAASLDGASGFFVCDRWWIRGGHLLRLFDRVTPLEELEVSDGKRLRRVRVWRVEGFRSRSLDDVVNDGEWQAFPTNIWVEPLSL